MNFELSNRVSPHSIDSEQALLACCIIEGAQESINICIESKIHSNAFFKPVHQIIYAALLELFEEGVPVDEIILANKLEAQSNLNSIGGYRYINEIVDRIPTTAHLKYYIDRVRNTYLLRRLINTSIRTIDRAYTEQENLEQFLEDVEQEFFRISEDRILDTAKPLKDSIDIAINLVEKMLKCKGELNGIPTGFKELDKITYGFHAQELIIIAGRPSMGKTSLVLNIAETAIFSRKKDKKPYSVLIFSLEMSAEHLAMRLLCSRARINISKLKDGFLSSISQKDLLRSANELKESSLWIDDSANLTILEMRAKARRLHSQKKIGIIIVDYLQLVNGTDSRILREQQIAEISRGLKGMAKELNIPIVVAAQLNRDSEKERRQPRLSDLRESGSIEQDADVVLLISKKKEFNEEEEHSSDVVLRDLIVAKQRNGPIGIIPLAYVKSLTRFESHII